MIAIYLLNKLNNKKTYIRIPQNILIKNDSNELEIIYKFRRKLYELK